MLYIFSAIVLILVPSLLIVTLKVTICNILDICQIVIPCFSIFLIRFFLLMLSLLTFFNDVIVLDLLRKKCPPKTFILPRILPFPFFRSGSSRNSNHLFEYSFKITNCTPIRKCWTCHIFNWLHYDHLPHTVIVSKDVQHLSSKSLFFLPSSMGYIISVIITTIIPVFWTLANEDLQEFAKPFKEACLVSTSQKNH